jgi:hypothetical protein
VTAYSYSSDPNAIPNNLETPVKTITMVPHTVDPGVRYAMSGGDTIQTVNHTGPSDGTVTPIIVDPTKTTGHAYRVSFTDGADGTTWKLQDVDAGTTLLNAQTNQSGDDDYLILDGIQVKVAGPPSGMREWTIPAGARRWTWVNGAPFEFEGFSGAIGWSGMVQHLKRYGGTAEECADQIRRHGFGHREPRQPQ